jgi:hypothetical protein
MRWLLLSALVVAGGVGLVILAFQTAPASRSRQAAPVRDESVRVGSVRGGSARGSSSSAPDPFVALALQTRLGAVADEIRELEGSCEVYAKAHRLQASRSAYDALLRQACEYARVPTDVADWGGESERSRVEVELVAKGWSW